MKLSPVNMDDAALAESRVSQNIADQKYQELEICTHFHLIFFIKKFKASVSIIFDPTLYCAYHLILKTTMFS